MIWAVLVVAFGDFVAALLTALGDFPVTTLPWGLDPFLVTAVGYWNDLAQAAPWMTMAMQYFLVYVGFRIGLFVLKFFRIIPSGHNN